MLGAQAPIALLAPAAGGPAAADARRDDIGHGTAVHLDVVGDHREPALDRGLQGGLVEETDSRDTDWGRIARLADPWGHGWCLLEFVNRGYDEIAT